MGASTAGVLIRFVAQIFIDSLGESYTALQAQRLIVWLSPPDTETAGPGLGYNRSRRTSDNSTARTERVRWTGRK